MTIEQAREEMLSIVCRFRGLPETPAIRVPFGYASLSDYGRSAVSLNMALQKADGEDKLQSAESFILVFNQLNGE